MNRKSLVWVGVVVVIVAAAYAGYTAWRGSATSGKKTSENVGTSAPVSAASVTGGATSSPTMQKAPSQLVVPGQNATSVPKGVAAPKLVTAGGPSGTTSYRMFNITETAHAFTPNTIIVNQGDTVHLNITASGGSYDFTQPDMGLSMNIPSGKTKVVQFDANTAGKFTFYCKSCGGPAQGPVGYIEVAPKQ